MGCRVSAEWQSEQLTASAVVSGGFLQQEVLLSELSGTVMCIRLCKRPPENDREEVETVCVWFFLVWGRLGIH